jgi:hypothetical protein
MSRSRGRRTLDQYESSDTFRKTVWYDPVIALIFDPDGVESVVWSTESGVSHESAKVFKLYDGFVLSVCLWLVVLDLVSASG